MAETDTPTAPTGVVVITLTLKPTRQGYQLNVSHDPTDIYPETVIDACRRTASFYEQQAAAHVTIQMLEQIRRVREQSQRIMRG